MPSSQAVDMRTLFLASVAINTLLGVLSIAFARREGGSGALSSWGWGALSLGSAGALLALPWTPDRALLTAAGNTLLIAGVVLLARGVRLFLRCSTSDRFGWGLVAAAFLWSMWFHAIHPSFRARTVAISALVGLLALRSAWELRGDDVGSPLRPSQPFTAAALAAWGVGSIVRTLGVLILPQDQRTSLMQNDLFDGLILLWAILAVISATVGLMWMEIQRLEGRLVEAASHDHLTGALNRAALRDAFEREASRSQRSGQRFAVAVFDVDGFKGINDRHGHLFGDAVLRTIVETLGAALRKHDALGRFGGDEFALIMPDADAGPALAVSERARAAVERTPFSSGRAAERVTVSAGLAIYGRHGTDWESLLAAADRALYEAKSGGRNRVVVAGMPGRKAE